MAERVWERFLTEQDKAHQALRSGDRRIGFGQKPAVLLIDLYRWVFGDKPQPLLEAVKEWPGSCGLTAWESVPHIQSLLSTAREARIPIAYVTGLDERDSGMSGWATANRRTGAAARPADPEMEERRRRQYDIIDEIAPMGRRGRAPEELAERFQRHAPREPFRAPGRRHRHYRRREHERLCPSFRCGRLLAALPRRCRRGVRFRPHGGSPRHQPIRHAREVRRRAAPRRDRGLHPQSAHGGVVSLRLSQPVLGSDSGPGMAGDGGWSEPRRSRGRL